MSAVGLELPNLDALEDDDLVSVIGTLVDVRRIALLMLKARRLRREGEIEVAIAYEEEIEKLYRQLPAESRW